ncbi:MAG: iron ABC transporter permease [Provencibacterium sp.]|nr:iron ABC transporter permease [Provencibacterium sp.]
MGLALLLALLYSLRTGSQDYSAARLWQAFLIREEGNVVWRVLWHVRIPRTLACCLAGAALAQAGALTQAVLNNAMASPNIIGVNAGAGFFALLAAVAAPGTAGAVPAASFFGALLTALFIYLLALRAGLSRTTLILAGVAVSSMLNAGVNAITLLFPDITIGAAGFMLGGFSGVGLAAVRRAAVYLLLGFLLAALLAADLDVLQLGEESAAGLGLHVGRTRFLAILAAALLAGAAVSFAGLLGFVGLVAPHAARRLVGGSNVWLLPASALLGAAFVLACDTLARSLFAPYELPVGIVLSLLGGPFFLWLLLRRKRGRIYD